jgi:hypothetical protein
MPQRCNSIEATVYRATIHDDTSAQQHRGSATYSNTNSNSTSISSTYSNSSTESNSSNSNPDNHCLIGMAISENGKQGPVVVADTGCNLVIVNRPTICSLNLTTEPVYPHFFIQFGDSRGRVRVSEVVDGGLLLGKMAVVDGAVENLGGIIMFTSRGYSVTFTQMGVHVMDQQGRLVAKGIFDPTKRLFLFNLRELIRISRDYTQQPVYDRDPLALRALLVQSKQGSIHTEGNREHREYTDPAGDDADERQHMQQQPTAPQSTMHSTLPRVSGAQPSIGRLTTAQIRLGRDVHSVSGHVAPSTLANSLQDGVLDGVPDGLTPTLVRKINTHGFQCPVCEAARRVHEDKPEGSGAIPGVVGAFFSWDEMGPISPPTPEGFIYIHLAMDLATGALIPQLTKGTGLAGSYQALKDFLNLNESLGHRVRGFRTDDSSIAGGKTFKATLQGYQAYVTQCYAERQRQDPVERQVHTLWRATQARLADSTYVGASQWGAAFLDACRVHGAMSNTRSRAIGDGTRSPTELFFGIRPDLRNWKKFGSLATWPKTGTLSKTELRNEIGVWLGLSVSGQDIVIPHGKSRSVMRAGVQSLWIEGDNPPMTSQQLEDILSGNTDPSRQQIDGDEDAAIRIKAAGTAVFNLRSWIANREAKFLAGTLL